MRFRPVQMPTSNCSRNPKKIPTNELGLKMVKVSLFIHQPDRVARKASDVQQLIGDIKHT